MHNISNINHFDVVKRDWRKVVVVTLLVLLLSLVMTLVRPFLYESNVSIFVIQKSSFSIDAYSATKSEERIANKLLDVVDSSLFAEQVIYSGFDIDKSYFPNDEYKRREKWQKTVVASVPSGKSKLDISVYHTDPAQALQISNAIAYTLTEKKRDYIGIDDIDLKVLDSPLVSKYPVKPNVILNLFVGLLLGFVVGVFYVIVSYDPRRDRLFAVPEYKDNEPHLVEYDEVPQDDSVEEDMEEAVIVPEIEELEEVEDLVEVEEDPEKPAESEQELEEIEEFELPDIEVEIGKEPQKNTNRELRDMAKQEVKMPAVTDELDDGNDEKVKMASFDKEDKMFSLADLEEK
jgi:capsular polysaccharide biosynthesis protein